MHDKHAAWDTRLPNVSSSFLTHRRKDSRLTMFDNRTHSRHWLLDSETFLSHTHSPVAHFANESFAMWRQRQDSLSLCSHHEAVDEFFFFSQPLDTHTDRQISFLLNSQSRTLMKRRVAAGWFPFISFHTLFCDQVSVSNRFPQWTPTACDFFFACVLH